MVSGVSVEMKRAEGFNEKLLAFCCKIYVQCGNVVCSMMCFKFN